MAEKLEERVGKTFADLDLDLRMDIDEEDIPLNDDMRELMKEVKEADREYRLSLDDPSAYTKFSMISLAKGNSSKAERWAKKSLKLETTFPALVARANSMFRLGDYKGALGYYNDALDYREEGKVYEYKYRTLMKRGMEERALEPLQKAIELEDRPDLLTDYADILVDLDRIKEAKEYYEKAEEIGEVSDAKEKKLKELLKEAAEQSLPEEYDKILELEDQCEEAWLGKAEKYWNMDKNEEAIECLEKAEEVVGGDEIADDLEDYRGRILKVRECPECGGTGDCPGCDGSGDCELCGGSGDCLECDGSGRCPTCSGSGDCPDCDGSGKNGWIWTCKTCDGTGVCQDCGGHGACETCEGTGDCTPCDGTGNCGTCNGSSDCVRCDGAGVIKEEAGVER